VFQSGVRGPRSVSGGDEFILDALRHGLSKAKKVLRYFAHSRVASRPRAACMRALNIGVDSPSINTSIFAVSDCLLATDRPMWALFCWLSFPVKTNVFSIPLSVLRVRRANYSQATAKRRHDDT